MDFVAPKIIGSGSCGRVSEKQYQENVSEVKLGCSGLSQS